MSSHATCVDFIPVSIDSRTDEFKQAKAFVI